jgi:hypothetical protein
MKKIFTTTCFFENGKRERAIIEGGKKHRLGIIYKRKKERKKGRIGIRMKNEKTIIKNKQYSSLFDF